MGGKDKISVIVPCYNVQKYVMRCFESIHNQTYGFENLEVIFVDDLSTDNTWSILELLQKKYPENVIAVKLNRKGLAGGARNLGMDISSGEYITFVDADDWIHPEMINVLYNKIIEEHYDFVQCGYLECDRKPVEWSSVDSNYGVEIFNFADIDSRKNAIIGLTGTGNVAVWGKLYNIDFITNYKIRFVENLYFEDNNFSFMCVMSAKKCCRINLQLYFYYVNNDGITRSRVNFEKIHDLKRNMNDIREKLGHGYFDSNIEKNCKSEIQIFLFWKEYCESLMRIEQAMNNEMKKYAVEELEIEPDILDNPYVWSISEPASLKRIDLLKDNLV